MNPSDSNQAPVPNTKPYLVRALYQWCVDYGFTPYVSVFVDTNVLVPLEYVKNNEIVLNLSPSACQQFIIDNEAIKFKARFNGVPKDIWIPLSHVMAIYSRENSQGMSFPVQIPPNPDGGGKISDSSESKEKTKSHLRLVK
jgi:stringent starvation protein B